MEYGQLALFGGSGLEGGGTPWGTIPVDLGNPGSFQTTPQGPTQLPQLGPAEYQSGGGAQGALPQGSAPKGNGGFKGFQMIDLLNGWNGGGAPSADYMANVNAAQAYSNQGLGNYLGQREQAIGGVQQQALRSDADKYAALLQQQLGLNQGGVQERLGMAGYGAQNRATDATQQSANLASNNQLAGVRDTNDTGENIAGINVGPRYEQLDILRQILGGGSIPGLNLASAGGGTGGGGLVGGGLASGGGTGGTTELFPGVLGGAYTPPPQANFRGFDDIIAGQQKSEAAGNLANAAGNVERGLTNQWGQGGLSVANSPGVQEQLASNRMKLAGQIQGSNNQINKGQRDFNAENALAYNTAQQSAYSGEQDRLARIQMSKYLNDKNNQTQLQGQLLGGLLNA